MQYLYSSLSKDGYLAALKRKLDNPFLFFDERITGIVVGPFFAVAHYQEWEWNRRITGECNRAWGFVKESFGELEIRYLRGRGLLSPLWVGLITILVRVLFAVVEFRTQTSMGAVAWLGSAVIALISCGVTAVDSGLTEKGQAGRWKLDTFLEDPEKTNI